MKIAIEGCAHGELNKIYESIQYIQGREKIKIDLLICCGDFQSVRNKDDMLSMAVPPKYREMKDFPDYYSGKRKAPILTLFIGGNHEAANYLYELPYGGWVAENIYYLGYAGVINFAGLRIGGLTGIFKFHDYGKSHYEKPPFDEQSKRSFYHVRSCDVSKLKLLSGTSFDIFLSHDWPKNIYNFGNKNQLMRFKPFLREEIESGTLGSNAAEDLLHSLKPKYWFSAHMHAKFSAIVPHKDGTSTKFLALDKCLPNRNFLQILDLPEATEDLTFKHDPYWLCILKNTQQSFFKRSFCSSLPDEMKPTEFDVQKFLEQEPDLSLYPFVQSPPGSNPQTEEFCERFGIPNPCQFTPKSQASSSTIAATRKLNIPKPKLNLPKPMKDDFEDIQQPKENKSVTSRQSDDDFDDLINPNNISSNPDEIDLSEKESDSSSDSDSDSESSKISKAELTNKNLSSLPSFIETPVKQTAEKRSSSDSAGDSSFTDSSVSDTTSIKKPKLIRRNQNLYTPSKDE